MPAGFDDGDLRISARQVRMYVMDNKDVPYAALKVSTYLLITVSSGFSTAVVVFRRVDCVSLRYIMHTYMYIYTVYIHVCVCRRAAGT